MKKPMFMLFCAALATGLTGCLANPPVTESVKIGNSNDYPGQAAGFRRARIIDYSNSGGQDPSNLSVGYNVLTADSRIASTIYVTSAPRVYPRLLDLSDPERVIYEDHKSSIDQRHPGAELLGETTETLRKFGQQYTALLAAYRYDENSMGDRQPVYSVLMVWRHGDNIVKLRSTTPFAQGPVLMIYNLKLLDAMNWTVFPSAAAGQMARRTLNGSTGDLRVPAPRS